MPLDRFTVLLERSGDEYFAYVPALPGCTSGGETQGETIENVKEAIRLTLEYRREHGLPSDHGRGKRLLIRQRLQRAREDYAQWLRESRSSSGRSRAVARLVRFVSSRRPKVFSKRGSEQLNRRYQRPLVRKGRQE